jgi:serine/threonine protein kinase
LRPTFSSPFPCPRRCDRERVLSEATRSEQEIVNLLKAQGLPHVVQLVGRTKDELVLQAAGKDLSRGWIEGDNPDDTPASTRRSWAAQLADALASLHDRGIFHRDITLMNALFSGEKRPCATSSAALPASPSSPQR